MLFNTPYFRVLNANTSSAPISIYTGKFLIQNREYGFKCEGIIKAILENLKADQNTLFRRYVNFEPPRGYF